MKPAELAWAILESAAELLADNTQAIYPPAEDVG